MEGHEANGDNDDDKDDDLNFAATSDSSFVGATCTSGCNGLTSDAVPD